MQNIQIGSLTYLKSILIQVQTSSMHLHPFAGILFLWFFQQRWIFFPSYLKICKLLQVFVTSIIMWSVFYTFCSWCHQRFTNFALIFHSKTHFSWCPNTIQWTESCLRVYLHWQWVWTSQVVCILTVCLPTHLSANLCVFSCCLIYQSRCV